MGLPACRQLQLITLLIECLLYSSCTLVTAPCLVLSNTFIYLSIHTQQKNKQTFGNFPYSGYIFPMNNNAHNQEASAFEYQRTQ